MEKVKVQKEKLSGVVESPYREGSRKRQTHKPFIRHGSGQWGLSTAQNQCCFAAFSRQGPETGGILHPPSGQVGGDRASPHFLPSKRVSNEYEVTPPPNTKLWHIWSLMLFDGIWGAPEHCMPLSDGCYLCLGPALISGRIFHHKLACHGKKLKEKNKPQCNLRVLGSEELQGGSMKKLYKNLFLHHNNVLLYGQ